MKPKPPPPPDIHASAFADLNRDFYRAEPAEYLDNRLWSLLTMIGETGRPRPARQRRRYGERTYSWTSDPEEVRDRYAALESTVLLHHACEALLRLYLAHAFAEPCPWLAISKLRGPGVFPSATDLLREDLRNPKRVTDLLLTFTASKTAAEFNPACTAEAWESHEKGLIALIRYAARTVREDAPFYNSAKHGLAILAGPMMFSLTAEDGSGFSQAGPTLEVLDAELVDKATKAREWRRSARWLDPPVAVEIAAAIVKVIQSLWDAARLRNGLPCEPRRIVLLDAAQIEGLVLRANSSGPLTRTSFNIPHV
ncbi:hypothetical protein [Pseudolysinimonas yzui]|uniref:Uncharacterized protein n=1 Tax=Pseudolysinimonas yzui TaxID=2708254 RepID=A0A8J3E0W3_9MICO|nr:hypothetical protein [Pseudolysinimonas yzui]GHF04462.1 hypothetical protein GCM10011600_01070 [Pseudolysinimonas yzui]